MEIVHKMRNLLERVPKCDYDPVKANAQAMLADGRQQAKAAAPTFSSPFATSALPVRCDNRRPSCRICCRSSVFWQLTAQLQVHDR